MRIKTSNIKFIRKSVMRIKTSNLVEIDMRKNPETQYLLHVPREACGERYSEG
jgi:hypothetical protein